MSELLFFARPRIGCALKRFGNPADRPTFVLLFGTRKSMFTHAVDATTEIFEREVMAVLRAGQVAAPARGRSIPEGGRT